MHPHASSIQPLTSQEEISLEEAVEVCVLPMHRLLRADGEATRLLLARASQPHKDQKWRWRPSVKVMCWASTEARVVVEPEKTRGMGVALDHSR